MNWIATNSAFLTALTSILLVIATTVYVVFTIKLVNETRLTRLQQLEPHLTLFLEHSETRADILVIRVLNLGNGVAYDVNFDIIKDISVNDSNVLSEITLFKNGIKYFPNKHEFKYTFSIEDGEKMKNEYIELKVNYSDSLKNFKEEIFKLELINEYGDGVITPPITYIGMISHNLSKIEQNLIKK